MNQVIIGSLSQVAQKNNVSLSESFMSCDCLILIDQSGSMESHDAPDNMTRNQAAREQLTRLQKDYPGKIAIVSFASYAMFSPAGLPVDCGGSTNMIAGLEYIKPIDDTGVKIILISDGVPNDQSNTLKKAKEFKTAIQTIYIGPEDDREGGRVFLEKLSHATGGESLKGDAPGLLANQVEMLLLKG